ncbi:transcriptional regulator family: Fungal Specific TF [Penicillium roqueforti]|nr:transcriptional regulator family: Fungal Specific TF [Penicillium roqueforti]KAI3215512.1 transcriptional regulator family: Fungal Specific TF [Penicillium roqueforti]
MSESPRKISSKRDRPKVPLDQRKRIVKACTQCRLRKRRCTLQSPEGCWNCRKSSVTCIFETREDSPAESPSSQTHIDDDVVARFNKSYPGVGLKSHHISFLFEIFKDLNQDSRDRSSKRRSPFWHTRPPPQHGTRPMSVERHPNEGQLPGDDILSHRHFLARAAAAVSQSDRLDLPEDTNFYPTDESYCENEIILRQQILKDFPSRAGAEVLMASFFSYAEANWYYFDESSFRKQLFELYDSDLSPTYPSLKFICLALTVFAMGSQFVHLYHADNSIALEAMTVVQAGIPGTRYFQHAQKLVPQIIASPSLEGLLSCLLLALYVLPIHSTETCYTYLGLALRIAISLGLHRKSTNSALSPSLSELHNRVFWTTYSIERMVALSLGYPETLQTKDIDCLLPHRQPDLDVPGSYRAERLLANTRLTLLLNEVICLRSLKHGSTEDIRSQLLAWKADLPAQLATLDDNCLRLNVHLQLHYSMIWIYIGRAALIDKVRRLLSKKEPTKDDLDIAGDSQELSDACAEHAARIIDLIDLLRSRGQLSLFSYTDFHTCSSATIIVLLDSILNPRMSSFPTVRTAMGALQYMATGSDLARNSLKYVHNFQNVVNKALASISCLDNGKSRPEGETGPLPLGEPREETFTEGLDMYQHEGEEPNLALFSDIGIALEDCSFTELHLLGLDSLYSSDVQNWNGS